MIGRFKVFALLTCLTLLFIWLGRMIGGHTGMIIAFFFALFMNFVSYWYSDKIVLAMYRAKPLTEDQSPQVFTIVRRLTQHAQLPMPKLYKVGMKAPNAFATGRDPEHAALCVTEGLLSLLNESELEGVLAHELGHVRNRDVLIQTVAATLAGAIYMLANMARWTAIFWGGRGRDRGGGLIGILIISIVAPICAMLIQLAISRTREYKADETGAKLSGNPLGLASALNKLAHYSKSGDRVSPITAHMFIVNPLSGKGLSGLFATHPPIQERIRRLRSMA